MFETQPEKKRSTNPRPRKYASAAERQAAYRERQRGESGVSGLVTLRLLPRTVEDLENLARQYDLPRNEIAHQLLTFALTNRNWFNPATGPFFAKRLPAEQRVYGRRATVETVADEADDDEREDDET